MWYGLACAETPNVSQLGKFVFFLNNSKINISRSPVEKASGRIHLATRPLGEDTIRKWERATKGTNYVCNQAAAFNLCVTKLPDDIQTQVKVKNSPRRKEEISVKATQALEEIVNLTAFNQNVFLYG